MELAALMQLAKQGLLLARGLDRKEMVKGEQLLAMVELDKRAKRVQVWPEEKLDKKEKVKV
ncbi:unnamed protein product [marine sediment metagenome]|uniref:Uncharacterized protein n=1 Tax=marine sediment metagenome TaxID=412755 RepID=X1B843_9ZZZZ